MISGEVTVKPQVFAAAVKWAAKFISSRPAAPVQAGLRLEAHDGTLYVASMNERASAVASVPHWGGGSGVAVVSGRPLAALAATFPAKAEVALSGDGSGALNIRAGRWAGTLPTMSEDDYPAMPDAPDVVGEVDGEEFARAVAQVAEATTNDEEKPWPNRSMGLDFGTDRVTMVATDRNRVAGTVAGYRGTPGAAVVLAGPLSDVAGGMTGPDPIKVGLSATQLSLASATRSVVMTTMDKGQYNTAEYAAVIAHNNPHVATVRRGDLSDPIRRATVVLDKSETVSVSFAPGVLSISAQADAKVGDEEIEIEYDGPEVSFRFSLDYFAGALSSAPSDTVGISVTDKERRPGIPNPIVFTAAGTPWRHVLMPRR